MNLRELKHCRLLGEKLSTSGHRQRFNNVFAFSYRFASRKIVIFNYLPRVDCNSELFTCCLPSRSYVERAMDEAVMCGVWDVLS